MNQATIFFSISTKLVALAAGRRRAGWRALGILAIGSLCTPAQAQAQAPPIDLLAQVAAAFGQRLETTLRYQEAVAPEGVRASRSCLRLGQREYVLERYTATPLGLGRVKEQYLLQTQGPDTVSTCTARFLLGNEVTRRGKTACVGVFHKYLTPLTIEAGQVFVLRTFSPADLLALAPGLTPAGQTLYVLNEAPDVNGDTLACYRLTRGAAGHALLTLQERRTAASRRWRHNTRLTYRWEADPAQRQVRAAQLGPDGTPGLQWVRTYANQTDFSESHFSFAPPEQEGDGMVEQVYYRREFRQISPQQALDHYTLPLPLEPATTIGFDIRHYSQ
jgi:hypothetical protein